MTRSVVDRIRQTESGGAGNPDPFFNGMGQNRSFDDLRRPDYPRKRTSDLRADEYTLTIEPKQLLDLAVLTIHRNPSCRRDLPRARRPRGQPRAPGIVLTSGGTSEALAARPSYVSSYPAGRGTPPDPIRRPGAAQPNRKIAVGTPITEHPPHRSVRARFGHTAPTLGD